MGRERKAARLVPTERGLNPVRGPNRFQTSGPASAVPMMGTGSVGVGQCSGIHPSSAVPMVGIDSAGEGNPRDKSPRQRAFSDGLAIGSADGKPTVPIL